MDSFFRNHKPRAKMNRQPKLVIWDFDGVISDTEHIWIRNWKNLLNKRLNIDWDFDTANKFLCGLSPKTKISKLKEVGINIDNDFLRELKILDWNSMIEIKAVEGVVDVFKIADFAKCIATGGNLDKTNKKLDVLNFNQYFPQNHIFTAQMVEQGKPEPDLFLFAAKQMGYQPQASIVIEDSLAGLTAALKAKMIPIAFLGCPLNNNPKYIQQVKELGIKNIFFNMKEIKDFLLSIL